MPGWRGLALVCTAAVALLAGCAAPPRVEVVLLPQEDGSSSAVQVTSGAATQKLAHPYQRFVATTGQRPKVDDADPAQIAQAYKPIFDVRPPKPQRFVVYFNRAEAGLTAESQASFIHIFESAAQHPGADIIVTGHTDTVGDVQSNDQLSLQRAELVRTMLMQSQLFVMHQVPLQRIEVVGRGKRSLAIPTADDVDEPRNRRVEILLR
ncbi:MAG: hypothetical protein JWP29_2419 [Rhodoferax sp.]|nr:hypothetical protein [Rhodoferax sp.]